MKFRHRTLRRVIVAFLLPWTLATCASFKQREINRSRAHVFIQYWPPPENNGRLRLAVKDLIDVQGTVTSAGSEYLAKNHPPAGKDAKCLEIARQRNVQFVGKTNLTEFAVTVSGANDYYGTPRNRPDGRHDVIPGGSSSGSAVAVATGMADVAFGTDTAGSIRIPAACCGIYGLKTTYGLVSNDGVFPLSPGNLDTVGPMAKDMDHLVQGMDLLQRGFMERYREAIAAHPSARGIRVGRLYLDGTDPAIDRALDEALAAAHFQVVNLNPAFKARWKQAESDARAVAYFDILKNDRQYLDKNGVDGTTKLVIRQGERISVEEYRAALGRRAAWQRDLHRVFRSVDVVALPTMQQFPPKFPLFGPRLVFEVLVFEMQNTVAVNYAGNPALAIPIPIRKDGKVTHIASLQLIGPRMSEAKLLNAGRLIPSNP